METKYYNVDDFEFYGMRPRKTELWYRWRQIKIFFWLLVIIEALANFTTIFG